MPAPEHTPAVSLLARVAGGDATAVREVLAEYGGLVWSIARRFESGDAEDAVQEIFLDLWKSAARFDPAIASEPAFIAMIARRRLIDRRRTRRRRPETQDLDASIADGATGPDVCAEANEAARALDQLRPEQRQVLVLSSQGLSHGEIAAETGMPLGTVKAHARRGLLSIRAALLGVDQGEAQ
ncbi:MAG TPA: sigma-70 family RNA polymerase sigma factor [Kofleriaceae bacterium]|nr:sigma-70 family RNA polymerase sigma factor [Kofleriaceae bacterium]